MVTSPYIPKKMDEKKLIHFEMSDVESVGPARTWDELRRARKLAIERINEAWDEIHDFEFEMRE
jgi:hypothetical protein